MRRPAGRTGLAAAAVALATLPSPALGSDVPTYGAHAGGAPVLLSNADGESPYTGVGRYQGRASCTAVFIETVPPEEDTGRSPAYILTNGHCPEFPGSNEVLHDRPAGRATVTFNDFADTARARVVVPVAVTRYATMKGTDLAIVELAVTAARLRALGIRPWRVTSASAEAGDDIVVVGVPLQRDPAATHLRLSACTLEGTVPLVVEYIWRWFDLLVHRCAGIAPGSSGSPVISRRTGAVLGLVHTTTSGGRAPYTACALDHPCEPLVDGEVSRPGTSYAIPLTGVTACFVDGWLTPGAPGCPLDPGRQVEATPSRLGYVNPSLEQVPLGRPQRLWNVAVGGPFEAYRYKVAQAGAAECRDPRGYGPMQDAQRRPLIDDPLPRRDGWWFLCLTGHRSRDGGADQPPAFATAVAVRIDSLPPRVPPPLAVEEHDLGWRVTFATTPPETVGYVFKAGRPSETRCVDPAGYRPALVPFLSLSKQDRPLVFCAQPFDAAGNRGRLIEIVLP